VTSIRPNAFPTPAQPSPADAARSAAQRAFFDAAMGRSAGPAPSAAPAAAVAPTALFTPTAAPIQRAEIRPAVTPAPGAEPPAKILRPGSLLDIRV
jgi:hypothetical protein